MTPNRLSRPAIAFSGLALAALALAGCAAGSATASSSQAAQSQGAPVSGAPSAGVSGSTAALKCSPDSVTTKTEHVLTIGTDKPAYPPYFENNNPKNGKGFESAVAYAVAKELGFDTASVKWVTVPFDSSYQPGPKSFDFDINQISVTPKRAKVVDFSDGYYDVNQSVVALKGGKADGVTTIAGLKNLKFGVQVGTTSYQTVKDVVKPTKQPSVFNSSDAVTNALKNKQVDAIVVDLPTAYFISGAILDNGIIVGEFPAPAGGEHFGMLFQKDSPLVPCVNQAVATLKSNGQLKILTAKWLGAGAGVVTLK